ncbi:MAG: hypothetical protein ACK5IB_08390 [Qingshengfaniella sp.]
MVKAILHPGFYKTATTSIQDCLRQNRATLAPHTTLLLEEDLGAANHLGKIWAERGGSWRLVLLRRALRKALRQVDPHKPLILSRETLTGTLPGTILARQPVLDYITPGQRLCTILVQEIRRHMGADCPITLVFGTRETEAYLRSVWGHHIRATAMTLDYPAFRARLAPDFDLTAQADAIHAKLPGTALRHAPVETGNLTRMGPAGPLLDLLDLPPDVMAALSPTPRKNQGVPRDVLNEMRDLNRTITDPKALKDAKKHLRARHQNETT